MNPRFKLRDALPTAVNPLIELDKIVQSSGLEKIHQEMIKIRASQINGCAYCLNIHTKDALKYGEEAKRIFVMSAWREAGNWFSEEEQTLLALTEEVTLIASKGVSDELFEKAVSLFGEERTAVIVMAIISINAWNRIGVTFHMHPL